ncbi:PhzF family phenazine biosynthesis protein [Arthrobacter sp. H14]|uniref:PhzF family phenazine biosynthesis protein n=1 Tax=Arthrobacter sp. H14 TaxID=1312959 RepID=UPI0009DFD982|nr:PhzF family phenazine biosynthesis protein [Arthrobacter sp. H14]
MADVLRYAAFTLDPSGGNPAGVVLDAGGMDDEVMQQVAADVGYSEAGGSRVGDKPVDNPAAASAPRAVRTPKCRREMSSCCGGMMWPDIADSDRNAQW